MKTVHISGSVDFRERDLIIWNDQTAEVSITQQRVLDVLEFRCRATLILKLLQAGRNSR